MREQQKGQKVNLDFLSLYFLFFCQGLYYGVTISLVSFATGLSVVTLNIHHRGMRGRELPPYMRRFIFGYLAKFLLLKLDMPKRAYLFTSAAPGGRTRLDKQCGGSGAQDCKPSRLGRRIPVVSKS